MAFGKKIKKFKKKAKKALKKAHGKKAYEAAKDVHDTAVKGRKGSIGDRTFDAAYDTMTAEDPALSSSKPAGSAPDLNSAMRKLLAKREEYKKRKRLGGGVQSTILETDTLG